MIDGTWTYIPVCEGFAQGCSMSPVFAAMVLGVILEKFDQFFRAKAAYRKGLGDLLGDNSGGVPIILAYVDNASCLSPLEDVKKFVQIFSGIGKKLEANLNTFKT